MLPTTRSAVCVRGTCCAVREERTAAPRPSRSGPAACRTTGQSASFRLLVMNTPMRRRAGPDGLVWSQRDRRGDAARLAVFHAPAPGINGPCVRHRRRQGWAGGTRRRPDPSQRDAVTGNGHGQPAVRAGAECGRGCRVAAARTTHGVLHRYVRVHWLQGMRGGVQGVERRPGRRVQPAGAGRTTTPVRSARAPGGTSPSSSSRGGSPGRNPGSAGCRPVRPPPRTTTAPRPVTAPRCVG